MLSGCGGPPPTLTLNAAPTQTREAEVRQLATLTVPTASAQTAAAPPTAITVPPTATAAPPAREAATLVSVTDGDTIRVRLANGTEEPVRYIGIDTPETKDPRTTVECFGEAATAKNTELLREGGGTVYLEKDITERDKYSRLLRYVWVKRADGTLLNVGEDLVRWGFAAASSYPPDVRYQAGFAGLERAAQEQRLGLWGACPNAHSPLAAPTAIPPTPPLPTAVPPRLVPPTATVAPKAAPGGRVPGTGGYDCPSGYPIKGNLTTSSGDQIYHVPGGQYYGATKPEECFATEADARAAGYRRSQR
jgi:micrococcal nuclease